MYMFPNNFLEKIPLHCCLHCCPHCCFIGRKGRGSVWNDECSLQVNAANRSI